jgi:hypothetical protein
VKDSAIAVHSGPVVGGPGETCCASVPARLAAGWPARVAYRSVCIDSVDDRFGYPRGYQLPASSDSLANRFHSCADGRPDFLRAMAPADDKNSQADRFAVSGSLHAAVAAAALREVAR